MANQPVAVGGTSSIRGLDIRVMFAKANILGITDPEQGAEDKFEACEMAQILGYSEAADNVTIPKMFEDVECLSSAWHNGFWVGQPCDDCDE